MHNYLACGKEGFLKDSKKTKKKKENENGFVTRTFNAFRDDDWETHADILKDVEPYLPSGIIWDPFYCSGFVIKEWQKLGRVCINEKRDAFKWKPADYSCIVTNCPFTLKKASLELCINTKKPFAVLLPWQSIQTQWFKKRYFNLVQIQILMPFKRYHFCKERILKKQQWQSTVWVCYKFNLPEKFTLLK